MREISVLDPPQGYSGLPRPGQSHVYESQISNPATHYQYGSNDRAARYSGEEHAARSSAMADALGSRQLPELPALAMRPGSRDQSMPQSSPAWSLPPIQTMTSSSHYAAVASAGLTTSPAETTTSRSLRTPSVSETGTISNPEDRARRSSSTLKANAPNSSISRTGSVDEDDDPFAQRISLLPDSGPVIPPIYEYGTHIDMKQKQNCGRRTGKPNSIELEELSDPSQKRAVQKKNEHTDAERMRRNDHKNLAMDLYLQTPIKFLQEAGWRDQTKEPVKKVQLAAAVLYMHDLSMECTKAMKSNKNLEYENATKDRIIAQKEEEIRALLRKLEAQDRRPSISSSKADSSMPDLSTSSSFKSESPTPDGRETYSFMEPRVPASGPSTPAFSLRSSPILRSRPVSRPGSPAKHFLPCPIGSNTDFQFPSHHKRKTEDPTWVVVPRHNDHADLAPISPKRARF